MALNKQIINDRGIETNYHKVARVVVDNNHVSCIVNSYTSPDYRTAEKPADFSQYNFTITIEEEESMGIRALCYTKLKELGTWIGAIDC